MKRILTAGLLWNFFFTPACAFPLYAGFQVDHITSDVFLGYQISNKYGIEIHASKSESSVTHAGVTVDTSSTSKSIVGIALFPIKLRNVLPCNLFVKAGYERTNKTETYSIPVSITLSLPYSGRIDSYSNQFVLGGGAEYDFTKHLTGRTGLDIRSSDRSFNMAVIYKF